MFLKNIIFPSQTLNNRSKSINVLFRYLFVNSKFCVRQTFIAFSMPPKKANSKRKAVVGYVVSDPFSASKKAKKDQIDEKEKTEETTEKISNLPKKSNDCYEVKVDEKNKTQSKLSNFIVKKETNSKSKKKDEENEEEPVEKNDSDENTTFKFDKEEFKKTSNLKEWNLKIVSWNINGIRAWLDKGGIDYLKAEDPDIFCCQETKCDKSKIPPKAELPNYHCYWLSGDAQGYSGVGLLSKVKPIKVSFGMNIPNSGRGLVRLKYRMEWESVFRSFLKDLDSTKPIIWAGDLNVAHAEIDLKNPKTNTKSAGFTKEERECFTNLLSDGYIDSFRYLYPTLSGAYTFWSYLRNSRSTNVGWRLDYFVMSERLKECLVDNMIRAKVLGSDHCPIALFLKF